MIVIAPAEPGHAEGIAALAEEMDRFYGASEVEPFDLRVRQINEALFTSPPSAFVLLAWDDSELVGFAAYSFVWPAVGLTRSLYLKELYVAEKARRSGVGKLLMHNLYKIAVERRCSRVEWTADRSNPGAQQFYSDLGVPMVESKLFYRLDGRALLQHLKDRGCICQLACASSRIGARELLATRHVG